MKIVEDLKIRASSDRTNSVVTGKPLSGVMRPLCYGSAMSSPRTASHGKIRRRAPKSYPSSLQDPALAKPFAELRAALDLQELWRTVVTLLDAMLPNFQYVAALPCSEGRPIWVTSTMPESNDPGYWERFIGCEPPLARVIANCPLSKLAYLNDHWPQDELEQTKFFKQVMKVEGWRYAAGFLLWSGGVFFGHIGMNRTEQQGPYLLNERTMLEELYPYIDEAVKRVAAFDAERARRAALEEVLKQIPDGMLILDWELRPVFSNSGAVEACQLWNESSGGHGADLPAEIKDAAGKLIADHEIIIRQPPPGKLETPVTNIFHSEFNGLGARLRILHPRLKQAIKPHCLIEFSRVQPRTIGASAVATYSLTKAERRVADLTASGKSNMMVAAELNLSVHTIRAHLREIFSKLGVKNRGELAGAIKRSLE